MPLRRADGRSASSIAARQARSDPRFTDDDLRLAETFAARAAVAVDLSERSAATPSAESSRRRSRSAPARARAARRDRAGADVDPARPEALEEARRPTRTRGRSRRSGSSSSRRSRTCGGLRSSCARRRSTTSGSSPRSSASRQASRADRHRGRSRGAAWRDTAPERGRDGPLPDRAGGADEHRQARRGEPCEHRRHAEGGVGRGRHRGRRARLRPERDARWTASGSSGCASASRWSAGRCRIESSAGNGDDAASSRFRSVSIRVLDRRRPRRRPGRAAALLDAEDDIETVGEAGDARSAIFEARAQAGHRAHGRRAAGEERDRGAPRVLQARRTRRCSCSRCRTTRATCARPSRRARSGYVLKEAADTELVDAVRGSQRVSATSIPRWARGSRPPTQRSGSAPSTTRSRIASARFCGCWRSATRTRRSRRCSSSPSERPRRTGPTSCRSSALEPGRARPLRARPGL